VRKREVPNLISAPSRLSVKDCAHMDGFVTTVLPTPISVWPNFLLWAMAYAYLWSSRSSGR